MKSLYVRDLKTREILHVIVVPNPAQVERVLSGMLINLNLEKYFVVGSELDERAVASALTSVPKPRRE